VEKWAAKFSNGLKARKFAEFAHDLGRKYLEQRKESALRRTTGWIIVCGVILLALIALGLPLQSQIPLKILITNDDGFDAPGLAVLF